MTEADRMMLPQVATDLLWAQVLTNELLNDGLNGIRQLARLVSICTVFARFHDVPGPVIGIQMTLG